jgi:hypothetical protein
LKRAIIVLAAILLWPPAARAALGDLGGAIGSGGNSQATATLFADVSSAATGTPFTVAVLLSITPGWHIYWQNPGDGGIGTRVQFTVPAGCTVSTPRFSVPRTFIMPGDIHNYGYEKSALVTAVVTPSKGIGGSIAVSAVVDWLACDPKTCVPGKASMNVTIPIGKATPDAGSAGVLAAWADRMPEDSDKDPVVKSMTWLQNPAAGALPWTGTFSLTVDWARTPNVVEWYPNPGENVLVKDISLTTRGTRTTVKFTAVANAQADLKAIGFPSVLAFDDDKGRHGIAVSVKPGDGAASRPALP